MSYMNIQSADVDSVPSSASSVTVFPANPSARARAVYNDSTAVLYLKFGATASTTSYTVQIAADGYYEFPGPLYGGQVDGIWDAANGNARTTEW